MQSLRDLTEADEARIAKEQRFTTSYENNFGRRPLTGRVDRSQSKNPLVTQSMAAGIKSIANFETDDNTQQLSERNYSATTQQSPLKGSGNFQQLECQSARSNVNETEIRIDLNKLGYANPSKHRRRCTDRFVRYAYPKQMDSHYATTFIKKASLAKDHRDAFNLEKETKIINPHAMELQTTMQDIFQGKQAARSASCKPKSARENKPRAYITTNGMNYPNWKLDKNSIFHEKKPQYPVYQTTFRGITTSQNAFTGDKMSQLVKQVQRVRNSGTQLKIGQQSPHRFESRTTTNDTYRDYKFSKPMENTQCQPVAYPVASRARPDHFQTTNRKELVRHKIRQGPSAIDLISYP